VDPRRARGSAADLVTARDVLEYLQHLREARDNGDSAINRTVTILRNFYRAIVAMDILSRTLTRSQDSRP